LKTILLTGKDGQVGWELQHALAPLRWVVALGRRELDLADPHAIRTRVRELKPDLIVNAAAYTAVDKAESEPELAIAINSTAPGVLGEEAHRLGALLVHYSTDYVFDGEKAGPYSEDDSTGPLGAYGRSKLAGERAVVSSGAAHLILRTSWVYGARGKNFLLTILRLARECEELRVVDDQIGAPTSSRAIGEATAGILRRLTEPTRGRSADWSGIYHLTAGGQTSWFGFAREIMEQAGNLIPRKPVLVPITTAQFPLPARRPRSSVLSCKKVAANFGIKLAPWKEGLSQVMNQLRHRPKVGKLAS
jgi:dTDP-4-dehydrorhamnose reductase